MTTAIAPPSKASAGQLSSRSVASRSASGFGAALEQRVDRSARSGTPEPVEASPRPQSPSAEQPEQPEDVVEPKAEDSGKPGVTRKSEVAETDDAVPTDFEPGAEASAERSTAPVLGLGVATEESGDAERSETESPVGDGPAKPVDAEGVDVAIATGVMQVATNASRPVDPTVEPPSVGQRGSEGEVDVTAAEAAGDGDGPADLAGGVGDGGVGVKTETGSARSTGKDQGGELPPVAPPAGEVAGESAKPTTPAGKLDFLSTLHSLTQPTSGTETARPAPSAEFAGPAPVTAPSYAPEVRFAEANSASIVQGVRQQLMPNGGTMTLRLDPPEVGALQVSVMMKDGLASVSFATDNPEAARLMTHTLTQLRDALSTSGLTVDRLTVSQTAKSEGSSQSGTGSQQQQGQGDPRGQGFGFQDDARRDQQRRDLLERMWRKVTGDDINVVA